MVIFHYGSPRKLMQVGVKSSYSTVSTVPATEDIFSDLRENGEKESKA